MSHPKFGDDRSVTLVRFKIPNQTRLRWFAHSVSAEFAVLAKPARHRYVNAFVMRHLAVSRPTQIRSPKPSVQAAEPRTRSAYGVQVWISG